MDISRGVVLCLKTLAQSPNLFFLSLFLFVPHVINRVIHDPDFDDNVGKTLVSLQLTDGKFVDIVDEDDRKIIVCLKHE